MSDSTPASPVEPRPTTATRILLVYLACLVGVGVFLFLLIFVADMYLGIQIDGTSGAVGMVVAAMMAGMIWAERERARPASGRIWGATLLCAVATFAIQAGLVYAVMVADPLFGHEVAAQPGGLLVAVSLILLAFDILTVRFGFWLGIRVGLKSAAARQAKG
ncbi:ABZJ_00895 family protein [uncultured Paracoccus sp.]|uniref:ABZJ_00895 family protein n=1 Tax=uncultured Paracoccus sp. TaxID=189685 RepID=UPI0025CC9869|nr:ABZJ_00895 family protein [uncultured Paracoccus sp.]